MTGQVVPEIEVTPSTLVLPRRSGKELVYQATSVCRSHRGESFELQPEAIPDDFSLVVMPSPGAPDVKRVRVEWRAQNGKNASPVSRNLRLRATAGGRLYRVVIHVHCRLPERPE